MCVHNYSDAAHLEANHVDIDLRSRIYSDIRIDVRLQVANTSLEVLSILPPLSPVRTQQHPIMRET